MMLYCIQTSCSFISPLFLSTDSDGIDFEEFVTIMVNYLQDPQEEEQELREAFQVTIRNLLIHQYYVYQCVYVCVYMCVSIYNIYKFTHIYIYIQRGSWCPSGDLGNSFKSIIKGYICRKYEKQATG